MSRRTNVRERSARPRNSLRASPIDRRVFAASPRYYRICLIVRRSLLRVAILDSGEEDVNERPPRSNESNEYGSNAITKFLIDNREKYVALR